MTPILCSPKRRIARVVFATVVLLLGITVLCPAPPAGAQPAMDELAGAWSGELAVGGSSLRIVFHIERVGEDSLVAAMDSPDQGAYGIAAGSIRIVADSVIVPVPSVGGAFRGVFQNTGGARRIEGSWFQGGASLPLLLAPIPEKETGPPDRPQEPDEPVPYLSEEVTFRNRDAGITLAGTFTQPRGPGPFPAVALLSGSGPQDRDEAIVGHRPFLVLADHLTRSGIAVLRYDDRGTAESEGDFASATTEEFARDAAAAVDWLAGRRTVDPDAIGLIGHSEGGLVAPMVSRRRDRVAFLVLLAGPALTGEEILYLQGEALARTAGASGAEVRAVRERQQRLFRAVLEEDDPETREHRLSRILEEELAGDSASGTAPSPKARRQSVAAQVRQLAAPWFRFFLQHDPAPILYRLDVPVLALYGEKDLQVPADTNAAVMERALEAAPTTEYEIRVLDDLNHLFQHAGTGLPDEYARIEETLAPEVTDIVSEWIRRVTGRDADVRPSSGGPY